MLVDGQTDNARNLFWLRINPRRQARFEEWIELCNCLRDVFVLVIETDVGGVFDPEHLLQLRAAPSRAFPMTPFSHRPQDTRGSKRQIDAVACDQQH